MSSGGAKILFRGVMTRNALEVAWPELPGIGIVSSMVCPPAEAGSDSHEPGGWPARRCRTR
jgi:hypothetical protein